MQIASAGPGRLCQPLANALKHGLEGWPQPGTIRIEAMLEDGLLVVAVTHDGAGLGGSAAQGAGLGLSNILARLALLYGDAAALDVTAGDKAGVCATLRLPVPTNAIGREAA